MRYHFRLTNVFVRRLFDIHMVYVYMVSKNLLHSRFPHEIYFKVIVPFLIRLDDTPTVGIISSYEVLIQLRPNKQTK